MNGNPSVSICDKREKYASTSNPDCGITHSLPSCFLFLSSLLFHFLPSLLLFLTEFCLYKRHVSANFRFFRLPIQKSCPECNGIISLFLLPPLSFNFHSSFFSINKFVKTLIHSIHIFHEIITESNDYI